MPLTLSTSPQTRGEPPRILVVEEETSLADTVRYNLKREGYAVTVAPEAARLSSASAPKRPPW